MSKKYKRKVCAYCAKAMATAGDHIFAPAFFRESERADLPQAPICDRCNANKSSLEHYLQPVFAFGGRHQGAFEILDISGRKKLERNAKLHRRLADGYTETSIPLDGEKVEALFGLIVKGLIWHHWKVYADDETHSVSAVLATDAGVRIIDGLVSGAPQQYRASANLGNRTFVYEGAQTPDDSKSSVWKFLIYGGLEMGEGSSTGSAIVAYVKPRIVIFQFLGCV